MSSIARSTATLRWPDYVVIGVMLMISVSIGIYYRFTGGRQKTTEEYFSANRSMKVAPLAVALMVSYMSGVTLLGYSAETYVYGSQIMSLYLGYLVGAPISIYLYHPVFLKLRMVSVYEYLERRFGMKARLITSAANSVQLLLYTGVVLYAPALALEATTNLSGNLSVILIGVVCTFYSTVGGIKAVLMTDVFQGVLMFVAVIMVIVLAWLNVDGGLVGIWQIAYEGGRVELDNFTLDPTMRHTWFNLTLGGACTVMSLYGVNQIQVQRLLTVKTDSEARRAMWWNVPMQLSLGLLTTFSGLCIYAIYKDCDPLASGKITATDMLMPYLIVDKMSHVSGFVGLFVAGIFSASLSTISAILNSLAAVTLEDYIKPACKRLKLQFPEEREIVFGKVIVVIIGLLTLGVVFIAKNLGSLAQATLAIIGLIGGPILGIFTLGMFTESANEGGAIVGTVTSLVLLSWAAFGQPRPSAVALPVSVAGCNGTGETSLALLTRQVVLGDSSDFYWYRISHMWYGPLGFVITIVLGMAASWAFRLVLKQPFVDVDPDLLTPPLAAIVRRRQLKPPQRTKSQSSFSEAAVSDSSSEKQP